MRDNGAVLRRGWERGDLRFVLPLAVALAMCVRARCFGLAEGGRFQVRDRGTVVLYSVAPLLSCRRAARPAASVSVEWASPDDQHATIHRVAWDAEVSSEEEIWPAIDPWQGPLVG